MIFRSAPALVPAILVVAAALAAPTRAQSGEGQTGSPDADVPSAEAGVDGGTHWGQWRGPDRSGHCAESAAPWPDRLTDRIERTWRVALGPSYSGPVVDAERVYTTQTRDKTWEVVHAFDRRTGEEVWTAEWKGSIEVPFFATKNGSWIRSTPAVDEDSLYVAGMRDVLVCLDKRTGEERWRVDFVARFDAPVPDFGFVCSPLVTADAVYVQASASFVKLDKRTGETIWRTLEDDGGMWGSAFSSPVLATLRGVPQLLVQGRQRLAGVHPDDGRVLWSQKVRAFRGMNILTPVPFGDAVFTSAYGGRGHLFAVTGDDEGMEVEEKWNSRAQGYMTTPVVVDDHAYLYLRNQRLTCVDLATGEQTWLSDTIADEYWSLVAQGDRILGLSDAGELYLVAADPDEVRILDHVSVSGSQTWAHLAVDGEQIFVREQDGLAAHRWR